eukprot:222064_1
MVSMKKREFNFMFMSAALIILFSSTFGVVNSSTKDDWETCGLDELRDKYARLCSFYKHAKQRIKELRNSDEKTSNMYYDETMKVGDAERKAKQIGREKTWIENELSESQRANETLRKTNLALKAKHEKYQLCTKEVLSSAYKSMKDAETKYKSNEEISRNHLANSQRQIDTLDSSNTMLTEKNDALNKQLDTYTRKLKNSLKLNGEKTEKTKDLAATLNRLQEEHQLTKRISRNNERYASYFLRKNDPHTIEEVDIGDSSPSSSEDVNNLFSDSTSGEYEEVESSKTVAQTQSRRSHDFINFSEFLTKTLGPSLVGCLVSAGTMIAVIFNILYQGAVGAWVRKNASCSVLISKFAFCGSLVTFLFGAAEMTINPVKAVHKGVQEVLSTISGMDLGNKILIGSGLALICALFLIGYCYRWKILRNVCGCERKISLKKFAHRPRHRHDFQTEISVSSYE